MKPKIFRLKYWAIRYHDAQENRTRTIYADTWEQAMGLVIHGDKQGYIKKGVQDMRRIYFAVGQQFDKDGHKLEGVMHRRMEAYTAIAKTFGGFNASVGFGGWIDDNGNLILEESLGIEVYTNEPELQLAEKVIATTEMLKQVFNQQAVVVSNIEANYGIV